MWKNDSARGQICHVSCGRTRVEDQEDKVTDWPTGYHQRPHVPKRGVHWSARVQGSMVWASPLLFVTEAFIPWVLPNTHRSGRGMGVVDAGGWGPCVGMRPALTSRLVGNWVAAFRLVLSWR